MVSKFQRGLNCTPEVKGGFWHLQFQDSILLAEDSYDQAPKNHIPNFSSSFVVEAKNRFLNMVMPRGFQEGWWSRILDWM